MLAAAVLSDLTFPSQVLYKLKAVVVQEKSAMSTNPDEAVLVTEALSATGYGPGLASFGSVSICLFVFE